MAGKRIVNDYQTVIWDWNGTLLNDIWLCVEIVNGMLVNQQKPPLDQMRYREAFGFPISSYYEKIGMDLNEESFERLTHTFISNYDAQVKTCQLHDYAEEILESFQSYDLNQFILTAAHKESVLELLNHYEIKDYFQQIEGLDNHRAESKVTVGKHLMEINQITPHQTILIGDTIHDYKVANELRVDCVLIANGHQSKSRLARETNNKVEIFDHIEELFP